MLEKIALQKKLISDEIYEKAVKACKGASNYEQALKEYFISNRLISEKMMNQLVFTLSLIQTIQKNARFGKLAVQMGFIGDAELQEALTAQKKRASGNQKPKLIGQLLIETGHMTKEQVEKVFDAQKIEKKKADAALKRRASPKTTKKTPTDFSLKEELDCGLEIEIDTPGMNVFLRKTDRFQDDLFAEDVLAILSEKMIQFGVVTDEMIDGFLRAPGFKEKKFQVAKGVSMIQGTDARIEYLFDTDYLKAGVMDEKGTIDFKERGEIPLIEAGTLLAVKIPMVESRSGRDIFGQTISADPAQDVFLSSKDGTVLSEDEMKLYAAVQGYPELTKSGEINVYQTFTVPGDVTYETGHITYKGDIEVQGRLKSGFRIKGRCVKVAEVDGGEIDALEDVIVLNGVNEGKITSFGNIQAKFIHQAKISCLGNLSVDKEIVDSEIHAGGVCRIESGEIINCSVSVNKGVFVKHLGTEKTNPNTIRIERNPFTQKKIKALTAQIETCQAEINTVAAKRKSLFERIRLYDTERAAFYSECEMIVHLIEQERKSTQDSDGQHASGTEPKKPDNRVIRQKELRLKTVEKRLDETMALLQFCRKKIEEHTTTKQKLNQEIETMQVRITGMEQWDKANKTEPVVAVSGTVFPDTLIKGPHAQKKIKEKLSRVKIVESPVTENESETAIYEFMIHDYDSRK